MDSVSTRMKRKLATHRTTLPKFLFIGALKTFSAVALNWLFIDVLEMAALIGSGIAYVLVFIGTYIAYVKSGTIRRGFVRYTVIIVAFNALAVLMVTLMVDHLDMAGYSSSFVTTVVLVFLRYLILYRFGVINTGEAPSTKDG